MDPCLVITTTPTKMCLRSGGLLKIPFTGLRTLLDRIDLHVEVTCKLWWSGQPRGQRRKQAETIRQRIIRAREIQEQRFDGMPKYASAQMDGLILREVCALNQAGNLLLKTAMEKLQLSARAYDRISKWPEPLPILLAAMTSKSNTGRGHPLSGTSIVRAGRVNGTIIPAFTIFLTFEPINDFCAVHHAFVFCWSFVQAVFPNQLRQKVACNHQSLEQDLIRWRRHLHANPELSNREFNTMQYIFDVLCATATWPLKRHGQKPGS